MEMSIEEREAAEAMRTAVVEEGGTATAVGEGGGFAGVHLVVNLNAVVAIGRAKDSKKCKC